MFALERAVDAGFDKAFWAVMDGNITTIIAALFLAQLGTGPIQGFAATAVSFQPTSTWRRSSADSTAR